MFVDDAAGPQAGADAGPPGGFVARAGSSRPWFVLVVLFLIAVLNYVDRTILSILQVPIKVELGLSDAQLGALTGLAFAIFYTLFALPIARLADRAVRKTVIAGSIFVWSGMTALTALANSFAAMLFLRIGVAVGEAGSVPATHSMISDLFPRERRASALGLWGMSYPVGTMLGFGAGGWLAANVGWRDAFLWIGLLGIVATPLFMLAVREPVRGRFDPPGLVEDATPSTLEAVRHLWNLRCFRALVLAASLSAWVQNAMLAWNAPYYARVHDLPITTIAGWLAAMNGAGAAIGITLGGQLSDRLGRRFTKGYLLAPTLGSLALGPIGYVQYALAPVTLSLVLGIVTTMLVMLYFACIVSVSHALVPSRMRAFTSAVIVLFVNLIGLGLGPLVTGIISDWLGGGADALRMALACAMLPAPVAAWLYWRAAKQLCVELPAATAKPG